MKRAQSWAIVLGLTLILGHAAGHPFAAETRAAKTDVPRTVYYESREHGALYGVPIGLFKGIGLGAVRTAVGLYELLTFPLPVNDYEPVVQPEFPFEPGPTEAFPDTP